MGSSINFNISAPSAQLLSEVALSLSESQQPSLNTLIKSIKTSIISPGYNGDFAETMRIIQDYYSKVTGGFDSTKKQIFRKSLVARMALDLPPLINGMNLPEIVLEQYPGSLDRLASFLAEDTEDEYGFTDDLFAKDICFVLARSIPCGAQIVELGGYVRPRSVVRHMLVYRNIGSVINYFQAQGMGQWYRIHTDVRNLTDFNEPGWDACYRRVAALLEQNSNIKGMVGTSWFYDPQLVDISPRLAYLQQRLLERGAFQIGHRGSPLDIERATLTSKTRRDLYKSGEYNPSCFSLVWPRKHMLSWAASQNKID